MAAHDPVAADRRPPGGAQAAGRRPTELATEHGGSDEVWGDEPAEDFEGDALFASECLQQAYEEIENDDHRRVIDLYVLGPLSAADAAADDRRRDERGKRAPDRVALPEALPRALRRGRYCGLSHDRRAATIRGVHGGRTRPTRRPFLTQVSGRERAELAALIDAFLERAPRRAFDPEALRSSPAAAVAESVHRSLAGSSGMWPSLLPQLRHRAQLKRADLVAQLAERLGAAGTDREGRPLLPPDGAGAAAGVGGLRFRARGAGPDRRLRRRRAAQGGRDAGAGRAGGGGRRGVRADLGRPDGGRRAWERPPPSPRNGTRSTASSADAIERQLRARRPTSAP